MASHRNVIKAIETKVPGDSRQGKESQRWAVVDGKKVLRVTYPKVHSGMSDIPPGTLNSIRRQLDLSPQQFTEFIDCTLSKAEYEAILRVR